MEDLNKAFKEEFPGSHIPLDQERAKSFIRQREKELLKEIQEKVMNPRLPAEEKIRNWQDLKKEFIK